MLRTFFGLLALILAVAAPSVAPARPYPAPAPVVLAAASLQESMTAAADTWAKRGHPRPVISFAGSSALARQIEAGAPADLFVSADEGWMDDLAARHLIVAATRRDFLGNRLVVVAPAGTRGSIPKGGATLARVRGAGPLAIADPDSVPAGRYAKTALIALGAWPGVAAHIVRAENVRAALALVERGAAPYGIVYATDARASRAVRVVGVFPAASHPPIVYPIARVASSRNPEGEAFRRFLMSPEGRSVFVRYGFSIR
ncbi:MAG: molybdate ABC transporter substrate-binding protein [Sphingomonas sp.]